MSNKKEQEIKRQNRFEGFRTYYANGQVVIDLESVNEGWAAYEFKNLASDINRQQIYGNKAGDQNLM